MLDLAVEVAEPGLVLRRARASASRVSARRKWLCSPQRAVVADRQQQPEIASTVFADELVAGIVDW